jgi:hypothetical protein
VESISWAWAGIRRAIGGSVAERNREGIREGEGGGGRGRTRGVCLFRDGRATSSLKNSCTACSDKEKG